MFNFPNHRIILCDDMLKGLSHQITVDRPESYMVGSAWMGILIADGGIRIANGLRNFKPLLRFLFKCNILAYYKPRDSMDLWKTHANSIKW